ncbi:MAG: MBL fold metallo-hydrolase [Anaerolineales bacterium]
MHTLELHFKNLTHAIAAYAIPHNNGIALIECGPGSTLHHLDAGLRTLGYTPEQVTDVLVTHIHLDHAGSAGAWARRGATIHVHPNGAPHLLNPEKLLASATRIYGDQMDSLWGEFLPVPPEKLHILHDNDTLEIGGRQFIALNTPGHANHHYAYLLEDTCFTGDVGGIRLPGVRHLRVPMPPPEINLQIWRESIIRLQSLAPKRLALTHYGIYEDADWHLAEMLRALQETDHWLETAMHDQPEIPTLNQRFIAWTEQRAAEQGIAPETDIALAYEGANPLSMSGAGMHRYWMKYRAVRA